ncbi:asparagine synthase (glutamine-hydrolyzing) [candidate division KSB3 bacterium]|uniref:asparagine synthase (glutamine-hydrolyzing) n=1 Tax=candidate division KSB3 bacterium TaxID=2044937 RepID=A0A9D5JXE4_9BACT|nr:asparagine synthase (glutamine-hydrolyzing) [candidate division KSB3 bacterium]MBD3326072.1 asparagine synthase (glutamine-hydrolyzing) [candidate division KSB3 bacterium]
MCGICGIIGQSNRTNIDAMVAAMQHRGPDDSGIVQKPRIALGMTRLSILDLTPSGHQPMSTPDGLIWIVYNGETYNFREERDILHKKGYRFRSTSDTEVVLRMYEEYGDDFLLRMRGMFALAIYDSRPGPGKERVVLARDQLGIKPLLYARRGNQMLFASELKALLASGLLEPAIDPDALRVLLTFGSIYQPRTMLKDVQMLLPAHRIIIEHGRERIERYWSLEIDRYAGWRTKPYSTLVENIAHVLEEAVRLQLVSDVPLGAFLSGGVDSSILVAMMAQMIGHRVKTFSVGFPEEDLHIDESGEARRTAHFLGTDHTHVPVTGNDVRERIRHIAFSLDQPSVDGVNSYFVSLAARQAVTVAISGTGGDEVYAGYPWFMQMVLDQRRQQAANLWKVLTKTVLATMTRQPLFNPLLATRAGHIIQRARNATGFVTRYAQWYAIFGALQAARVLAPDLRHLAHAGKAAHYDLQELDEVSQGSPIERVTGLCLRGYTNNQLLRDIDAVSMAHSLEVRVPYLDPVVVDTALSLPDNAKIGTLTDLSTPTQRTYRETGAKRILIDVGKSFLPPEFDNQPKRGFTLPFDLWLKGPLKEILLDTLSPQTLRKRGFFDVQRVSTLTTRFLDGSVAWTQPWLLMMVELWCQEILDQASSKFHQQSTKAVNF